MTEAKALWKDGTNFTGISVSGSELGLGSGKGDFRPMELLAIGLAGCTAMDVISILEKKRQEVTAFEVTVSTQRAEDYPKVFTRACIQYKVSGHALDEEAVLRSIELSVTRYCPVHAMLEKVFPIDLEYEIYEDRGEAGRDLVVGGSYVPVEQVENG